MVAFLPIGLAGFLFVIAPSFLQPMFDPDGERRRASRRGMILIAIGGIMMFIGFMIIRRIVDIEV